jgi:integrase
MTAELPSGINRTVAKPRTARPRKSEPYGGERQWFTAAEIEKLMTVARKHGRYGFRDSLMVLLGYVHGFRASELVRLQWSDIDWERGLIPLPSHKKWNQHRPPSHRPRTARAPEAQGRTEAPEPLHLHDGTRSTLHAGRFLQAHGSARGEGQGSSGSTPPFTPLLRVQACQ